MTNYFSIYRNVLKCLELSKSLGIVAREGQLSIMLRHMGDCLLASVALLLPVLHIVVVKIYKVKAITKRLSIGDELKEKIINHSERI
ncbi:hypothetical protein CSV79_12560 [Sporosarcina sp. P13]|nr:hypothetical protein CSV79_12560 [Sporosarcina sp. P13]